jgi:hypothetical protein
VGAGLKRTHINDTFNRVEAYLKGGMGLTDEEIDRGDRQDRRDGEVETAISPLLLRVGNA